MASPPIGNYRSARLLIYTLRKIWAVLKGLVQKPYVDPRAAPRWGAA